MRLSPVSGGGRHTHPDRRPCQFAATSVPPHAPLPPDMVGGRHRLKEGLLMMKHTPLYEAHLRSARNVINLKDFARPVEYVGHAAEHRAIRERVSLCDVSHMGEVEFRGPDALALVQKLIPSDAERLKVGQALYSALCDEEGRVIDDLVCWRRGPDWFLWVANVTKADSDVQWILRHAQGLDVEVRNLSTDLALIALQGPYSAEVLQRLSQADLAALEYYHFAETVVATDALEVPCLLSRTGYTGERGFELCLARDHALPVWEALLAAGQPLGILPHGVAARESARTEAGYLLNGNDMDGTHNPYEAGLGWLIAKDKTGYIGRDALLRIKQQGPARKLVGLAAPGSVTIRHGDPVYREGQRIGQVTSGPLSPALVGGDACLGLGYVPSGAGAPGTTLEIEVGGARHAARVVPLPFRPRRVREAATVATRSPYGLRFSADHVWVHANADGTATLGVSDVFERLAGEVLSARLPAVGERLKAGGRLAWLDTYRRVWEVPAPLAGQVVAVSDSVARAPADINRFPFAAAGLLTLRPDQPPALAGLADFAAYRRAALDARRYEVWSRELRLT
ncbi:MAG: glycine cleavage system aminomethyltransferase GcvT [Alphaproteobacteria bacterium]|nr:glycine cleavage system aminomethyltransferase GcvT [Alphaproteobacteria bacterium]